MPPKKRKFKGPEHPIDASGVLQAAKMGNWNRFHEQIIAASQSNTLTDNDFNELPPGRSFGVIHQIAYHSNLPGLRFLLSYFPRVDLKLLTKDSRTALEVAVEEVNASDDFIEYLKEQMIIQAHHQLINSARDGRWEEFFDQLDSETEQADEEYQHIHPDPMTAQTFNTIPPGRTWGVIHQVCYWGDVDVLERLTGPDYFPTGLDLELETNEEAPQQPTDIAIGRGHTTNFVNVLRAKIEEAKPPAAPAPVAGGAKEEDSVPTTPAAVTAPSCAMKAPVPAAGKLCNICYMEDHDEGTMAVSCDNGHHMCVDCFSTWVDTESDIEANPQNILLNGGRITCVCKKSEDCSSPAFANKLIAMVVADEIYEKYLRARDFVVGKEAVAGALSKIAKNQGDMDAVEQEQIRNMYRLQDGTYSAYMCGQCKFGPIDHGWCSNLASHHGEKKQKSAGGFAQVNNSCPKCGWFASDIQSWPRWDGQFQSASVKPAPYKPPPVAAMTVSQLKAQLKLRGAPCSGNKPVLMARLQALYDQQNL